MPSMQDMNPLLFTTGVLLLLGLIPNCDSLFLLFYFIFCGTRDGMQGRSTSALRPRPYFFLYFILKPGLMRLQRASLSRERGRRGWRGERERERERARAEAGREPDPLVSASQSTGITRVRHHAWPKN